MEAALYAEIQLICVIIGALLIIWAVRGGISSQSQIWMFQMFLCFEICFVADFAATLTTRIINRHLSVLTFVFEMLAHLFLAAGVFVWGIYAEVQYVGVGEHKTINFVDTYLRPALPVMLVILTNVWTKKLFYVDASGQCVTDVLFHFEMGYLLICSIFYTVRLLLAVRKVHDSMKRAHMAMASVFPVGIAAGWLLKIFGKEYPVLIVMIALGLLVIYLGSINFQISMDWLTQVNNRQNLMGYLNHKVSNHRDELYLMMLDVDKFKHINDEYGHLEGDQALTAVSSGIKQACGPILPRPYIARYGGDEFTVVMEAKNEAAAAALSDSIRRSVAGAAEDRPYELSISVGMARHQDGQKPRELIREADERLYEIKQSRKKEENDQDT